jgi:hypothetical protein
MNKNYISKGFSSGFDMKIYKDIIYIIFCDFNGANIVLMVIIINKKI